MRKRGETQLEVACAHRSVLYHHPGGPIHLKTGRMCPRCGIMA